MRILETAMKSRVVDVTKLVCRPRLAITSSCHIHDVNNVICARKLVFWFIHEQRYVIKLFFLSQCEAFYSYKLRQSADWLCCILLKARKRTFNDPRRTSVGWSPIDVIIRMMVERISTSIAGRRGTVSTIAADINIIDHRRPDSFGSRSAQKHNHYSMPQCDAQCKTSIYYVKRQSHTVYYQ